MLSKSNFFKSYFLCLSASYYQYFALPLLLRRKPLKRSTSYRPCRSIVYWFNDLPFQCSFVFIRMLRRFFQPHNFCQNHSVSDRSLKKRCLDLQNIPSLLSLRVYRLCLFAIYLKWCRLSHSMPTNARLPHKHSPVYSDFRIRLFALSTTDVSNEAR